MTTNVNLHALPMDELRDQARILGVKASANVSKDELIKRLNDAIADGSEPDSADDVQVTKAAKAKPKAEKKAKSTKSEWRTIVIAEDEYDRQPVFVGVNGKSYRIKRGEPVSVPASVVEALTNALQRVTNPRTGESKMIPTYSFRVE